uniref:Uncharacterized protein n=1 Tax=Oryza glumipatula TaxID=40148 RepID=A0A0D9Z0V3_9ORYZ
MRQLSGHLNEPNAWEIPSSSIYSVSEVSSRKVPSLGLASLTDIMSQLVLHESFDVSCIADDNNAY